MASNGKTIPLAAVANLHYELEPPIVWRRNRLPTVTVRANIVGPTQPATIVQQLSGRVDEFKRTLPADYRLETGGPVEESAKSQGPIAAVVPLMLFVMATILMIQLQSFQRLFMVIAVAPLGLIGVVAAMRSQQFAYGLCRPPWRARADRHFDSQFGDLNRAD